MRTGDSFNVSLMIVSKFSIGIKCGSCPHVVTITLEQCRNIFGTFHKRTPIKIIFIILIAYMYILNNYIYIYLYIYTYMYL